MVANRHASRSGVSVFGDYAEQQVAPPVFGAEYAGNEDSESANTVFVATQQVGPQDTKAQVELRQDQAGRLVMLAYSSLDSLIAGAGEFQPWISVLADRFYQVQQDCGADVVQWDVELPPELRRAGHEEGK